MSENLEIILLCEHCIDAIRSRGEKVFVAGEYWDFDEEDEIACEWCEETEKTLYECHF